MASDDVLPKEAWVHQRESDDDKSLYPQTDSELNYCYINDLPEELLLNIFSFFSVDELCTTISPVCKLWWNLYKDPSLWKRLRFSYEHPVDGSQIKILIKRSPLLSCLELQSREDGEDLLKCIALTCPRLRKLTLKFCDGLTDVVFADLAQNCTHISHLNIEGSRIMHRGCYDSIAEFTDLTYLNLSHCHYLDNAALIDVTKNCLKLQYIDIDGVTGVFDPSIVYLTSHLSKSLTHLYIDGENLTDCSFKSLSRCTKLKQLGVSFCEKMTDAGLSGIHNLTELTFLKLRKGVQLTPRGLRELFEGNRLSLLTHVNLGECTLTDDSVLIAMASTCKLLKHLVLHWCWDITDNGVDAIIKNCHHIRILDLVGVVQLTGRSFKDVTTLLPHLAILDLEQCNNINDDILREVVTKANNPMLKIFDYWGDLFDPYEEENETEEAAATLESNKNNNTDQKHVEFEDVSLECIEDDTKNMNIV